MMTIFIDNMTVRAHHGVLQQERVVGADFLVSLRAECEIASAAIDGDNIEGTVSYADMVDIIKEEMSVPSKLLEHVVARIARRVLGHSERVSSVWVRVTKCNPPVGRQTSGCGVEWRLER